MILKSTTNQQYNNHHEIDCKNCRTHKIGSSNHSFAIGYKQWILAR